MTLFRRAVTACTLGSLLGLPIAAHAQRADSYTWKLGFDVGSMIFTTHSQASTVIPSAGAHVMIMARRSGLMLGVDEGFGSDERTNGGLILFNDLRRYQAVLVAFPFKSALEPYFGVGGGLLLDGKLWRGPFHTAGEIGHVILFPGGQPGSFRPGSVHLDKRLVADAAHRNSALGQ